jgi:hypothetical protein
MIKVHFQLHVMELRGGGKASNSIKKAPCHKDTLLPWKEPLITTGWMCPRANLDTVEQRKMSCSCWELNPSPIAPSLISYPGSWSDTDKKNICSSRTHSLVRNNVPICFYSSVSI